MPSKNEPVEPTVEELLENIEPHDRYELDVTPADEMDEDDWANVIDSAYYLVGKVLERKLPKELTAELTHLYAQLERMLETYKMH
jgi:hypothetical protein